MTALPEVAEPTTEMRVTGAPRGRTHRVGDEAVVLGATGVVSLLNYGYTIILLYLLPAREFAEVGSISALLLVCGTIAGAALPWVLAQEVLRSKENRPRRRIAVTFCLVATMVQGVVAGLVTCLIAYHYASSSLLVAAFCSVFLIFVAATAAGFFQGQQRFRYLAVLRVSEVVVKLGSGVALIALGAGASGAVAGFALGASVVVGFGLAYMVRDIRWSWSALSGRSLWSSARGLLAIQAGVAMLASMDVIIGSLILGAQPALATYQAANILGRVPVFFGAAISIVVFPRMIASRSHPSAVVRESVILYLSVCIPVALVVATLPVSLIGKLFPARYGDVGAILPWSAMAGLAMGVVNLTTTYFQATAIFRRTTELLTLGVVVCAGLDVGGLKAHGIVGLAIAVTVGGTLVAAALFRRIHRTWPGSLRGVLRTGVWVAVVCLPLVPLRSHLVAWTTWALVCSLLFCVRSLRDVPIAHDDRSEPSRPRVLHLGYEDPRRPGAGGGRSARTRSTGAWSTPSTSPWSARDRGSRERTEDGSATCMSVSSAPTSPSGWPTSPSYPGPSCGTAPSWWSKTSLPFPRWPYPG